jgi:hypothetical protein
MSDLEHFRGLTRRILEAGDAVATASHAAAFLLPQHRRRSGADLMRRIGRPAIIEPHVVSR